MAVPDNIGLNAGQVINVSPTKAGMVYYTLPLFSGNLPFEAAGWNMADAGSAEAKMAAVFGLTLVPLMENFMHKGIFLVPQN